MLQHLPVLVVIVPLLVALVIPIVSRFVRGIGWPMSVAALAFSASASIRMLLAVWDGDVLRYSMGGWPVPAGIEYSVDRFTAMVLTMVAVMALIAALWMRRSDQREIVKKGRDAYHAVFTLFATGLLGITITGDVFNLYVFLEISSITSYVLIAMGRSRKALFAGFSYLILGSLGATFILLGIGHLYMATGTLAMADLADKVPLLYDNSVIRTSFAFFTVGFGLKMALFPLHGWQPNAYTHAPSGASVFIAATSTKVAAYGFYRISFTVFGPRFLLEALPVVQEAILVMCCAAIVFGPLLALRQGNLKRLLAYSSVGQIGYIMMGVVLFTEDPTHLDGTTGGLMHFWNHAVAKGALFCVAGALVFRSGGARVSSLEGMGKRAPWTSMVLTIACLSMIGIPFTAGFWSKLYLATGAIETGRPIVVVVLLLSSLLTAAYSWRLLSLVWFPRPDVEPRVASDVPWSMRLPSLLLAAACLILFFFPVHYELSRAVAEGFMR